MEQPRIHVGPESIRVTVELPGRTITATRSIGPNGCTAADLACVLGDVFLSLKDTLGISSPQVYQEPLTPPERPMFIRYDSQAAAQYFREQGYEVIAPGSGNVAASGATAYNLTAEYRHKEGNTLQDDLRVMQMLDQ